MTTSRLAIRARSLALRGGAALLAAGASLAASAQADAWQEDARKAAAEVPPRLAAKLLAAIDQGGPAGAIEVCRVEAPRIAAAASEHTGWAIRRVSLKPRNPKAVPDAWELATLQDFDRRAAAGESPASLERADVVTVEGGGKMLRYMRALPTQALCLQCHGPVADLSPGVTAQLKALYPADQAVGYRVGEIRGAITLKRPQ